MSNIDDTEKRLRDFAEARKRTAGSAPLTMPGPMRERLRLEINAMNDCDSAFERTSGFSLGALLRVFIPTAAVAAVAVVSFQAWERDEKTQRPSLATNSLQKEETVEAVGAAPEAAIVAAPRREEKASRAVPADQLAEGHKVLADATATTDLDKAKANAAFRDAVPGTHSVVPSETFVSLPSASVAGVPMALASASPSVGDVSTGQFRGNAPYADSLDAHSHLALAHETPASIQPEGAPLPLAKPGTPDYGVPRQATLAPTVPSDGTESLTEPASTLRFRASAPSEILSAFAFRRSGGVIELTDSDGSRYLAAVERRMERAAQRSSDLNIEHFSLSGVNKTTGRRVLITGTLFETAQETAGLGNGEAKKGPSARIHALVRIEGQSDPIAIEASLEK